MSSERVQINVNRESNPFGLAFVGYGNIAVFHTDGVIDEPSVALCGFSTDDRKVQSGDARHITCNLGSQGQLFDTSGMQVVNRDDYQLLFQNPRVHGVVICAPTKEHHKIALEAKNAGKHVLVEKPIASTSQAGRAMQEAFASSGLKLMVNHELDVFPPYHYLSQLIDANRENIAFLRMHRHVSWVDVTGTAAGGGRKGIAGDTGYVGDLGPHDIGFALKVIQPDQLCIHESETMYGKVQRAHFTLFSGEGLNERRVMFDIGAARDRSQFIHSWELTLKDGTDYWFDGANAWRRAPDQNAERMSIASITNGEIAAQALRVFAAYSRGKRSNCLHYAPGPAIETVRILEQIEQFVEREYSSRLAFLP